MGRKKRRSSKFRDSSTIIDIEQARQERQERQAERQKKKKKMEARSKPKRSAAAASRKSAQIPEAAYWPEPDSAADETAGWDEAAVREAADAAGSRLRNETDAADSTEGSAAGSYAGDEARRSAGGATGSVAGDTAGEAGIRQDRRRMALRRRKRNRAMFVMGVVLALVILVGFSLGNIVMLKYDLHVAKKEQEQYKEEKAQLEEDMQQINDLDSLEEQARDQMRLIKPGETLYIFPEEMAPQGQEAEDPEETGNKDEKKDKEQ